jgi:2-hydroxychromene-2-carboxylate isomerase
MNDHEMAHRVAPRLEIEVYSDIVCPWCYIGKRRLEGALDRLEQSSQRRANRVTWRPFELNPTMPRHGMDRQVYLEAKFGGPEALQSMQDRVAAVGAKEGIPFAFDRIIRTPNTFDAHRLIWHAERQKKQDDVVEALFTGTSSTAWTLAILRRSPRLRSTAASMERIYTVFCRVTRGKLQCVKSKAEGADSASWPFRILC